MAHSFSVGMTTTALIPRFALFGVPLGLALSQLDNLTISFAKPSETDEASGGYDTSSWLGSSLGTAVGGALLVRLVEAKPPTAYTEAPHCWEAFFDDSSLES